MPEATALQSLSPVWMAGKVNLRDEKNRRVASRTSDRAAIRSSLISRDDDGIVVVRGRESEDGMDFDAVPEPLRERLGPEATAGLLQFFDLANREGAAEVIQVCTDRFERRLIEEIGGLRLELASGHSGIRQDMNAMDSGIRQDMKAMASGIRQDMTTMESGIRQDMTTTESRIRQDMTTMESRIRQGLTAMESTIRQDLADTRFELLKWAFVFWAGQFTATLAVVAVLISMLR